MAGLHEDKEGLPIFVGRSKTGQEGTGIEKAIPHGRFTRPVALVGLNAGITDGPAFRPVSRSSRVRGTERLMDRSIAEIVKGYVASDEHPGMAVWREELFALMQRNVEETASHFCIPAKQVMEIGTDIEI